ncbi:MAG TPA: putative sulfate exporter family transporter [Bryobacteraceae bacterium]|nr:putative sulfate exporter family transporter [Bryobacteraceae bacterium]
MTRWYRNEDWLAVIVGAAVIIAVVAGIRPPLPQFGWKDTGELANILAPVQLSRAIFLAITYLLISAPGAVLAGASPRKYAAGFPFVFALGWVGQIIAGNATVSYWGIEYVIFALLLGLAISNGPGVPEWLADAVRTEYYIKTGLVIMGATILFSDIMQAGALGLIQAIAVVAVIWYFSYWLAKRLRLDDEFSAILASAVAICGVSAAIAACGAIHGDRRKLSYVASVVLIVAVPMIVLQPWMVKAMGMPDVVGGAWLGGTLDTTGSVVAASALISEAALKIGTIVKFSQNVLIGVAAFLLSLWWTWRKTASAQERAGLAVIWQRFPKFVLGFVGASLVFSFLLDPAVAKPAARVLGGLRTFWFSLAFVSIGLETKFTDLVRMESGRPLLAFLGAQAANVVWTLLLAYLIFGGFVFPPPQV